ncbi:MAG: Cof-type HAD-IIB family hydrolase [Lachnospiraceae bacterium]
MSQKIKLLCLDLDGTVLDDQKRLSKRNTEAITKAIQKGVTVAVATGRSRRGLPSSFMNIPGIRYAVTMNGATIFDFQEQRPLATQLMNPETVQKVFTKIWHYDCMGDFFIDGVGYIDEEKYHRAIDYVVNPNLLDYVYATRQPISDFPNRVLENQKSVEKITVYFYDVNMIPELRRDLSEMKMIDCVSGIPNNLEITHRQANKGNGIIMLGNCLGIQQEEIMAIGDSGNDLAMIQAAGIGVAVANATEEVKAAADVITASNLEDGVAQAIEQYVL